MIKTLLKSLLMLVTLGYLGFALIKVSRPTQEMVCTGVEYTFTDSAQASLIDQPMVETLMLKNDFAPKGKILADIDMSDIAARLSANPYIDTVTCYHTASGKLCIRVTPRHPLLHVFAQDGNEVYVDGEGNIMPAGGMATNLPIVTGNVTRKTVGRLLALGKLLQDDEYWNKETQQISVDEKGWIEIIPRYSGQRILLGEPKDLEEKLARVRLFYEKAMPKVGWNKYSIINAIYKDQVICKK
jgi:cell division protein FtsQ